VGVGRRYIMRLLPPKAHQAESQRTNWLLELVLRRYAGGVAPDVDHHLGGDELRG
jgi:hypothetical protein